MKNSPFLRSLRLRRVAAGFTLVELTVSTALVAVLMLLLLSTVDNTQKVWKRTSAKAQQFQSARKAFDAMTRRLSQATLNTYWRAIDFDSKDLEENDYNFRRQAELQFLCGHAAKIFTAGAPIPGLPDDPERAFPTHAVFFQAPIGYTENTSTQGERLKKFRNLDESLSSCGYFVEYGDDPFRPNFLGSQVAYRQFRYRLMELTVPTELLSVYHRTDVNTRVEPSKILPQILDINNQIYQGLINEEGNPNPEWIRPRWMKEGLERDISGVNRFRFARILADNVIALVILPKRAPRDQKLGTDTGRLDLAITYEYDSWRIIERDVDANASKTNVARYNLLPPVVQVVMVALDEESGSRAASNPENLPNWTNDLFKRATNIDDVDRDIAELEKRLREDRNRLNFRIFSADVVLRGAKWSLEEQETQN